MEYPKEIEMGKVSLLAESIEKSLVCDSVGLLANFGELELDELIDSEALKEIPLVGWAVNLYKVGMTVSDKILTKKILHFLSELHDISPQKRDKFRNKLSKKPKFQAKVGEQILLYLDKIENLEKCRLIGLLMKSFFDERIGEEHFFRLVNVIEKTYLEDLLQYVAFGPHGVHYDYQREALQGQGLLTYRKKHYSDEMEMVQTQLGSLLILIFRDELYPKHEPTVDA